MTKIPSFFSRWIFEEEMRSDDKESFKNEGSQKMRQKAAAGWSRNADMTQKADEAEKNTDKAGDAEEWDCHVLDVKYTLRRFSWPLLVRR